MAETFLFIDIFIRQIDAAGEGHLAVHHQNLAVVPVVVMGREHRTDRGEHSALYPFLLHHLREEAGQIPQHIGAVAQKADLHALPGLFLQDVQHRPQHMASGHDEELQEDEPLRLSQLLHHIHELAVPQGVVLHLGAVVHRAVVAFLQVMGQLSHMRAFCPQPVLGLLPGEHIFFRIFRQVFQPFIHDRSPGLHHDGQIKDGAEDREDGDGEHPRKLQVRIARRVVDIHHRNGADDQEKPIEQIAIIVQKNIAYHQYDKLCKKAQQNHCCPAIYQGFESLKHPIDFFTYAHDAPLPLPDLPGEL